MDSIHAALAITGMEYVGIVVDDLAAATEFFVGLGLEVSGEGSAEGGWVDRIVGSTAFARRSCSYRPRTAMRSSS